MPNLAPLMNFSQSAPIYDPSFKFLILQLRTSADPFKAV